MMAPMTGIYAAMSINDVCTDRNFVLVINGMRDFNLHYEILRAAQKSLSIYGLSDEKLRNLNRALETAGLFFDRNKGSQITLFEQSANQHGWFEKGPQLVSRIKDSLISDDTAFEIINDVCKKLVLDYAGWDAVL